MLREDSNNAAGDFVRSTEVDLQRRKSLGIYYTPRNAAAILAKWAIRNKDDTVLEPSFGGCTILEAALSRLRSLGCRRPEKQIFGFDIDEAAFAFLRKMLGQGNHPQFILQDFLQSSPSDLSVTTVIANPPFVSYHRMNAAQRKTIRSWRNQYSATFSITGSSWAYFLMHSLSFLKENGRIAFIHPLAVITSDYSKSILEFLENRFSKLMLFKMNEQLFVQAGADERTVILLGEGYLEQSALSIQRVERAVSSLSDLYGILNNPPKNDNSKLAIAASSSREDFAHKLIQMAIERGQLSQLRDSFEVSIGEVIGDTDYFVKSRDEWGKLRIPARHLQPIVTRMRQISGLRITKNELSSLYSSIPLLLLPRGTSFPNVVQEYIDRYPEKERLRNVTFCKRKPWYRVTYDTKAFAFIGSLSHDSPKVILNSAGISCANGLYKLKPKLARVRKLWIAAASLTTVFRYSAELQARIRGAGALKLEPSGVAKLLLPTDDHLITGRELTKLVSRLENLVRKGEHESATREADAALLINSKIFTSSELQVIRNRYQDLRGERQPRKLKY